MKIHLSRFGEILTSRPAGRDAALAIRAYQKPNAGEKIELSFDGVLALGPSWLAEVLQVLEEEYGKKNIVFLPSTNSSVVATLKTLQEEKSKP